MKSAEIKETVKKIGSVRSVNEIDNQNFGAQVGKLCHVTLEYFQNKFQEPAAAEIIAAFLSGEPSKAYRRLVELRSGRSLGEQTVSSRSAAADIEDTRSHFSFIYRNFNSSFLNAMRSEDVRNAFLNGGCIEAALGELSCKEFTERKNKSREESPIAKAIGTHLLLIYNVSNSDSLKGKLAEELKKYRYFHTIKEYARSAYDSRLLLSCF